VPYEAIRGFAKRTLGYIGLVLADGRKLCVTGIPGRDRKAIRAFLQARMARVPAGAARGAGRQNLCPHCYEPVAGLPARCPHCQGAFKSGARAGWLSLLMPGLGDLYLGHRALGAAELFGVLAMWSVLIPGAFATWWESTRTAGDAAGIAFVLGVAFTFAHGIDALITRRTGRKGLHPAD
jgi:hypothetical protein